MKTKNILIFGGLLALGVIGYIVISKKSKAEKVDSGTSRISHFNKPTRVTASVNPAMFSRI